MTSAVGVHFQDSTYVDYPHEGMPLLPLSLPVNVSVYLTSE